MPGVSKEQINKAKKIDLLTYLETYEPGAVKQTSANEYCLIEHDSLKISNGKWHWFSRNIGGKDALTFLVKVRGMDFVDAVNMLCCDTASHASYFQQIKQPIPPPTNMQKSKDIFNLPEQYKDNFRVIAYLLNRGIDRDIIDRCIEAGTLYESKNYHNAIFVGKNREGKACYACARSTINNFRQDIEGSDKRYGFNIPSDESDARFIMLAEAPIDILSLATMRKMASETPDNYHYLSLGGISTLALVQYLTDNRIIDHIIICLDNDKAGQKCMDRVNETINMDEMLKHRRITVIREPPPAGKDYNDTLLAIIEKQKVINKQNRKKEAVI